MTASIRTNALKGRFPDRTNDVPPPTDRSITEPCDKCDGKMVGRIDTHNRHQGYLEWYWWCGCGHKKNGGRWHPETEEELVYKRWKAAQGTPQTGAV